MWSITNLIYQKEDNIVVKIEAKYELTTNGVTTLNYIWVNLQEPTGDVIPFNDLTEQVVLNWVFNSYDTNTVEIKVQEDHNNKLTNLYRKRLPWII